MSKLFADASEAAQKEIIRRIEEVRDEYGDIRGMGAAQGALKGKILIEFLMAEYGVWVKLNNIKTDRSYEIEVCKNKFNITSGMGYTGVKMNWEGDAETAEETTKHRPTAGLIFLHHPRHGLGSITVTSKETLTKIQNEMGLAFFDLPKGGDSKRGVAYSTTAMHRIVDEADERINFNIKAHDDILEFNPYERGVRNFKKFL